MKQLLWIFLGIVICLVSEIAVAVFACWKNGTIAFRRVPKSKRKGSKMWFAFLLAVLPVLCSPAAAQLMPAEREAVFRKLLPKVGEAWLQDILDSQDLVLYTETEMPKVFQSGGVHSVYVNIAAIPTHETGNGNVFPWRETAGMQAAHNGDNFKFLYLPRANGKRLPIVYWQERLSDAVVGSTTFVNEVGYRWIYPIGATVGEVLLVKSPAGYSYPFEVRVRNRVADGWRIEVYRPFREPAELADRIVALRPNWSTDATLSAAVARLRTANPPMKTRLVTDRREHRSTSAYQATGAVDPLPSLGDDKLVVKLLTSTTFEPVSGGWWREAADGTKCFAPTTEANFHVVPAGYRGDVVAMETADCMRCHQNTNRLVRKFDMNSEWYGQVMGSDGIFSLNPFAPQSIKAGLFAAFDAGKHGRKHYVAFREE